MKNQKRKELKKLRDSLENRDSASALIEEAFLSSDIYKTSDTVLLYYAVGSEISTIRIFQNAISDGKRVAFPFCTEKDGVMEFYLVDGEEDLENGKYNIKAPRKDCDKLTAFSDAVCVVPGLSFDKKGYRLGYGKGYYDRFLSEFSGISVGLCYEALLSESLPFDCFDKRVDYLITDKKTYKF